MFDRIAPVYDTMNRVMTAGLDRRWRRLAVREVVWPGRPCPRRVLRNRRPRPGGRTARRRVVGLDFSEAMLERAARKSGTIEWVQGDALALPFGEAEFDAATVGFGVRNLEDLEGGLRELHRVLRPGGRSPCSRSRGRAGCCGRSSASGSTCSSRCREGPSGRAGLHVPAGERSTVSRARRPVCAVRARRVRATSASGCSAVAASRCTPRRRPS